MALRLISSHLPRQASLEPRTASFSTFLTYASIGIRYEPGTIATYTDLISSNSIISSKSISSNSIISSNGFISCNGFISRNSIIYLVLETYYVFYSFALDDLPKNSSVPAWISGGNRYQYWGDVFLVKMAPHLYGQYGWAAYEDIVPDFLDLLVKGPSYGQKRGYQVSVSEDLLAV
jgi:hypothetical protein